ncbi:MAG: hypothetical protein K2L86_13085 [Lachnospiraceae bacterium]|nr:hypothetical protein [Lachnospiraceae bacterium]
MVKKRALEHGINMTKQELEQLISLRKEIEELEQDIQHIEQMDIKAVPVKVDASSQCFPYVKSRVTVQGYDPLLADRRDRLLCEKITLLCERKKKAAEEENHLLQYINNVKESRVRRIMQYRYVEGYSWEKIGCIMHFDRRTGERIVSRYLKRNKNSG